MTSFRPLFACLSLVTLFACNNDRTLFRKITSSESGIRFNNRIAESDTMNPLDIVNIYNGGGVGIGDFNNDGLQDVYLTGNMVSSKLYLNKGDFEFEDITAKAGAEGMGRWARGVAVVDINNDSLPDIYICNTISNDSLQRRNILYINEGADKSGIPHFKDMAAEFGLDVNVQSTMANFFDYDNDSDLDVYITVNEASTGKNPSVFRTNTDNANPSTGRLYRNDWDPVQKKSLFHNISKEAGITFQGYGHAAIICDLNTDGWKDIYVANDFISDNILYINNHNGTFTNRSKEYFKHTSFNSMGIDIIDINNDGLADVFELDMSPADNYRKKTMSNASNYLTYQNFERFQHQFQYVRNTLQLNLGPRLLEYDSIGDPVFADIGFMSGIAETDWSWTPLIADFDNDSYRDIIVTNGFPKDITDHDFMSYRRQATLLAPKAEMIQQIPEVKLANYAFRNSGELKFSDVTENWGLTEPSFANGAAYADFDNDGDLDFIINNINDEVSLYENSLRSKEDTASHYLQVTFTGDANNRNGIGAIATIYYDGGKKQRYENTPYRGYLSTHQNMAHFGMGKINVIDSMIIDWPGNKRQVLTGVKADQKVVVNINDSRPLADPGWDQYFENNWFTMANSSVGVNFTHRQGDYVDFNIQKLLPHKLSEYSPAIAAGDVNGDKFDDFIVGGSSGYSAVIFFQKTDLTFLQKSLLSDQEAFEKKSDDRGLLLFDADTDGDLDLYIAKGGYASDPGDASYRDILYINDGHGNFKADSTVIPVNLSSKSCARACDYDKDGDLDLFIGGRVKPWNYPVAVSSFIYRNDSKNGKIVFTDATASIAPVLNNIGLTCDALWTDFDNDGWIDLVLAGEWMPLTFLKNNQGRFADVTNATGIAHQKGWWNSIAPGDFDNDGDMDYIAGNLGENSFYQASDSFPISIYAKDFDANGTTECIPTKFFKDKMGGTWKEFTVHTRDDVVDQMPFTKKNFLTYKSFANATFSQIFTPEQSKDMLKLQANYLHHAFVRNMGGGKFVVEALPVLSQASVINGMVAEDFDSDGNLDVCLNTNDYGTDPANGRYDALNGLMLKGNGDGTFTPLNIRQSGIYIPGNGKGLAKVAGRAGSLLVATQNRGPVLVFNIHGHTRMVEVLPNAVSAIIEMSNGKKRKVEFNYGSSFLSQSSRTAYVPKSGQSITFEDYQGKTTTVSLLW
jgi:hypothetical protein